MQNLQDALNAHKKPMPHYTREQLLDGIQRMNRERPYACEEKAWQQGLQKLITATFDLAIAERYPRISRGILDLKRTITLANNRVGNRTYDTSLLEFPDFARVRFGDTHWRHEGNATATYTEYGKPHKESVKYTLTADVPPLTERAKQQAREAESYLHDIMAHALATPILGDILLRDTYNLDNRQKEDPHIARPTDAAFNILWRPRPDQLKAVLEPPERDPALLIDYATHLYLVATWDTQHELAYRHLLREYALDCTEDAPALKEALRETQDDKDATPDLPF